MVNAISKDTLLVFANSADLNLDSSEQANALIDLCLWRYVLINALVVSIG
jgi:hypothetical protein